MLFLGCATTPEAQEAKRVRKEQRAEERRLRMERQAEERRLREEARRQQEMELSNFNFEVTGASQEELFTKAKNFVDERFKNLEFSRITSSQPNSSITGLAVNGMTSGFEVHRVSTAFTITLSEGSCHLNFSNPTSQHIGFTSPEEKELAFSAYLTGYRLVPVIVKSMRKTDAEVRADWERENGFSPNNPGPQKNISIINNQGLSQQWQEFANGLRTAINRN